MMGIFDKALADLEVVLESAQESGHKHDMGRAFIDLGKLWASRNYQKSEWYFQQALDVARQLKDPVALGRSLNRLGNWYVNAERPREGVRYHLEAKTIFDGLDNPRGQANTLDLLGMASLLGGDSVAAKAYYTDAIAHFEGLEDLAGLVSSLTARAESSPTFATQYVYPASTLKEAVNDGERALQMSREIGWRAGESFACWSLAQIYGVMGRYGEAIEEAQTGLAIAVEIDHFQWMAGAYGTLGYLYHDLLDWEMARGNYELALEIAKEVDSQYFINSSAGELAQAHILLGDLAQARACLEPLISPETPMISVGQRILWKARAELALAESDNSLALQIADRLISAGASMPADGVISILWHMKARIMLAAGKQAEVERLLLDGIENAHHFGEKAQLWRLYGTLGRVYREQSNSTKAEAAISTAREIVDDLAATLPERDVRDSFIKRAQDHIEEG
jgi:tetratricopeptide (TPR) repeat protein